MAKILVAEDDKFLSKIYEMKLSKEGFDVELALDGEETINKIKQINPVLVLLDLIMPKKTGYDVLEEMSKSEDFKNIPVIVMSNLGQDSDVKKAMDLGAKGFIIKAETSMEDIIKMIKENI